MSIPPILVTSGAALLLGALWAGAPAAAASAEEPRIVAYAATIAAPVGATRAEAGGVTWTCAQSGCSAEAGAAPPLAVCRDLAKRVGRVAAFTAGSIAFTAEELRRCNRPRARVPVQRVFPPQAARP